MFHVRATRCVSKMSLRTVAGGARMSSMLVMIGSAVSSRAKSVVWGCCMLQQRMCRILSSRRSVRRHGFVLVFLAAKRDHVVEIGRRRRARSSMMLLLYALLRCCRLSSGASATRFSPSSRLAVLLRLSARRLVGHFPNLDGSPSLSSPMTTSKSTSTPIPSPRVAALRLRSPSSGLRSAPVPAVEVDGAARLVERAREAAEAAAAAARGADVAAAAAASPAAPGAAPAAAGGPVAAAPSTRWL